MILNSTFLITLSLSATTVLSISLQVFVIYFSSVSSTLAICSLNLLAPSLMHPLVIGMISIWYPGLLSLISNKPITDTSVISPNLLIDVLVTGARHVYNLNQLKVLIHLVSTLLFISYSIFKLPAQLYLVIFL